MLAQRLPIQFNADPKKVILCYLDPGVSDRLSRFTSFVKPLSDAEAMTHFEPTKKLFAHRHRYFEDILRSYADRGIQTHDPSMQLTDAQKLVFGSYLAKEYSVEAAALFNPSMVPHPDQSGLRVGETRFVMTLRSVGEGHISSIGFMEGTIDANNHIEFTKTGPWRTAGIKSTPSGGDDDHYDINFNQDIPLPERVIFPQAASESMGMEDLRMVRYEDNGDVKYLGTYTAYNGKNIQSKMLETTDFQHFNIRNLRGSQVDNKGMAFFPRKIDDRFVMLSRQGGEVMGIMKSDDYMTWDTKLPLQLPTRPWELVQNGNCGSPIETPEGWLMITHHVGPLRRYALSVSLLDLDHPEKVISILKEPLMEPLENEREGYVPNVLYTCGWMKHRDNILIPYAMSDVACGFAIVNTTALLAQLKADRI
jgi:predicted GH43/DUF377 family glycosyl hydrolase